MKQFLVYLKFNNHTNIVDPFNKIIFCLTLLFSTNLQGQNFNIPYRKGNLWGYADTTGKIIIMPKYDSVSPENVNNRWLVFKKNKIGVINDSGREVIPVVHDFIMRNPVHSMYNEFYVSRMDKKGYTDMDGNIILPIDYKEIVKYRLFAKGNLLCFLTKKENDNNWTLVDGEKKVYLSDISAYDEIYGGYNIFAIEGKHGIYNMMEKKWMVKPLYDSIKYIPYKNKYRLKDEYKEFKYYGVLHEQLYLISEAFETKALLGKTLDDLLEQTQGENELIISKVSSSTSDAEIVSVTGSNYDEKKVFKTVNNFYQSDIRAITIVKDKNM